MRRRYAWVTVALGLLAGGASADKPATLTDTNAFRTAYGLSYFGFDLCGDDPNGALYRKALAEKIEHCPFTPGAKAGFRQWAADTDTKGADQVKRYIAEHDKLPESLDPKRKNCRTQKDTPAYQKTIALLIRYAKGEVRYDTVVPDACDTKAGAP
ncbi:MAG TPA: hypothetical protein VH722_00020 [Alphaproteobacteria bacterium]|jgi:hypothetical protein|nr:hypothetical protein [Alphaproteobacteria bacterium]